MTTEQPMIDHDDLDRLRRRAEQAEVENVALRGALQAQDSRERAAGEREAGELLDEAHKRGWRVVIRNGDYGASSWYCGVGSKKDEWEPVNRHGETWMQAVASAFLAAALAASETGGEG